MLTLHPNRLRHIPADAQPHSDNSPLFEIFLYRTKQDRPAAIGFIGPRMKPDLHYLFPTEEYRTAKIEAWVNQRQRENSDAEARKSSQLPAVGNILRSSWGYDQTNINFYRVEACSGRFVTLIALASTDVSSDDSPTMQGEVIASDTPRAGAEPFRRAWRDGVKIESYEWATTWNGKPERFTSYA